MVLKGPRIPIESKIRWMKRMIPALGIDEALHIAAFLEDLARQDKFAGCSATVRESHFGPMSILVAREIWNRESGWKMTNALTALKSGVSGSHTEQFSLEDRTREKLAQIEELQPGPIIVFPVRFELIQGATFPELGKNEFYLDLIGSIWNLASRTRQIEDGDDVRFACLGSRYEPKHDRPPEVPIIGYEDNHRRLYSRPVDKLKGSQVIIGNVPVFT